MTDVEIKEGSVPPDTKTFQTAVFGVLPHLITAPGEKVLVVLEAKPSKSAGHHLADVLLTIVLVFLAVAMVKIYVPWRDLPHTWLWLST